MTEQYLIFAGRHGSLVGGWHHFLSEAPDLTVAQDIIIQHLRQEGNENHWYQVVDLEHLKIVKALAT